MTASDNSVGVIILGNSGVGKSYLGNVILGREVFKHEYQGTAVTVNTEYQKSSFNKQTYAIYNIPGLIEAEQELIDLNKREIDVAFRQHPNAVVLYVFGTNNGRIRNEDVVAFNALNEAYPFSQKSLVVIVNNVNPNRPKDYEDKTRTALSSLLKMHLPHLCFVMEIRQASEEKLLRQQLEKIITSAMPTIHSKMQEINLQAAEISKLMKQIAEFQKQIAQHREEHRLEVKNLKKEFEERERRQRAEQEARERQLRTEMETKAQQQRAEQAEKERRQGAKQDEFRRKVEKEQQEAKEERKKLEDELKEYNAALGKCLMFC
jgi:predicted GTPase